MEQSKETVTWLDMYIQNCKRSLSIWAKEERKPCPFCGSQDVSVKDRITVYVSCGECGATVCGASRDEALEKWNRRE